MFPPTNARANGASGVAYDRLPLLSWGRGPFLMFRDVRGISDYVRALADSSRSGAGITPLSALPQPCRAGAATNAQRAASTIMRHGLGLADSARETQPYQ
jgi:hypothetical protein